MQILSNPWVKALLKKIAFSQLLTGQLRYLYTRIQPNSEEIAFFCGERTEASLIHTNYERLKRLLERLNRNRLWYVILEQFLLKYVWSAGRLRTSASKKFWTTDLMTQFCMLSSWTEHDLVADSALQTK
jgi:ABC-type uncharacterized transport system fused permease/ATPase subunit